MLNYDKKSDGRLQRRKRLVDTHNVADLALARSAADTKLVKVS